MIGVPHHPITRRTMLCDRMMRCSNHHLCEPLQHQLTIDKICQFSGRKGMGSSPDPFGAGAYNLQSISALRP